MSNLTDADRLYLEEILDMGGGYVLDYTDATFKSFFTRYRVNIYDNKYNTYGHSKAKRMRSFWEKETNEKVAEVLSGMLDYYKVMCELEKKEIQEELLSKCTNIIAKLLGKSAKSSSNSDKDKFLHQEFGEINLKKIKLEPIVTEIIQSRIDEAHRALGAKAYLSVIFLCGSVLEGALLGVAQNDPKKFNTSDTSPKDKQNAVKKLHDWTLAEFINTAYDVKLLPLDVKKFSHSLREFRNYIHPYQQMSSEFNPSEGTARICLQVLKAALTSLANEK